MALGYIAVITNELFPGVCRICVSEVMNPEEMTNDLNKRWAYKTQFKLEFAKHVFNAKRKETDLITQLSKSHVDDQYFRVSPNEVQMLLDNMDGDAWNTYSKEMKEEKDGWTEIERAIEKERELQRQLWRDEVKISDIIRGFKERDRKA